MESSVDAPPSNYGKVYVFNCYNEPISSLKIREEDLGGIPAWSQGKEKEALKYTPNGITVLRSKNVEPKCFSVGTNKLFILWASFTGTTKIEVPSPVESEVSLEDDLILFLCKNETFLLTKRGGVVGTSKIELEMLGEDS
jgi:hypothetical protein